MLGEISKLRASRSELMSLCIAGLPQTIKRSRLASSIGRPRSENTFPLRRTAQKSSHHQVVTGLSGWQIGRYRNSLARGEIIRELRIQNEQAADMPLADL